MIEALLKNKTAKEKAKIKSQELVKVKLGKFTKGEFDVEIIGDIKEIDGGIELFARAWKGNKQLGFGKDGSIDIERFRFFNPPILVDDINGDIIREWEEEDFETGNKIQKQRKLRYDPQQSIKEILEQTILQVGKKGKDIVKGKIGNTTSTFYPSINAGLRYDPGSGLATWNSLHDATDANSIRDTEATTILARIVRNDLATQGWRDWWRGMILFDTSVIDTDIIDSATISLYCSYKVDDYSGSVVLIEANPASTSSFAVGDYDNFGTTELASRFDITSFVSEQYNDFSLNASGISNINKTGISKFGFKESNDFDDTEPSPLGDSRIDIYYKDEAGTSKDPKLVVEHSAPGPPEVNPTATFKLTPDTGQVSGTNTNMPLVVIPSDITNFPSLTSAEAESIRFYSDASLSTELPREVVSADEIHVKVSSVSSSTEIWADYDGIRSDYAVTATYGAENVWSDFAFVSHDGGGGTDSSGNATTTAQGGVTSGGVAGKIGNATDYDGGDDFFKLSGLTFATAGTISAWVKPAAIANYDIIAHLGSDGSDRFIVQISSDGANTIRIYNNINGRGQTIQSGSAAFANGTYSLAHVSLDGSNVLIHFDGVQDQNVSSGNNFSQISPVSTGVGASYAGSNLWDGDINEFRIANVALTGDWRTTEYNNQNDNAAFWVATEVETVTASPIAHILQMI